MVDNTTKKKYQEAVKKAHADSEKVS